MCELVQNGHLCKNKNAMYGLGNCKLCDSAFCTKHRLPESHVCTGLETNSLKERSYLQQRLLAEKTINKKI